MCKSNIEAVVGLGNPGKLYSETFHNAGFLVVQKMVQPNAAWRSWKNVARVIWDKPILFLPQTFVNLSGNAVRLLLDYRKLNADQILIVYDDFSLDLGKVRIKQKGSSGGHNGLASIIQNLGTEDIPRIRVGIGPLENNGLAKEYVLKVLKGDVKNKFMKVVDATAEILKFVLKNGIEKAMNTYNGLEALNEN
ncbi:MAG: aminoacyl-tRNA hydrolase [bacterium]